MQRGKSDRKERTKSYKDHRGWDRCRARSCHRVLLIRMPFFGSLSEFIASLSPRRQQPADRQLQHRQPSHRSNPPSTRRSPSPTPARPRRRINFDQHQLPLSSDPEGNHHGSRHIRFLPHSARDQDIDVSEQVCGFQLDDALSRVSFLCFLVFSFFGCVPPYLSGPSI